MILKDPETIGKCLVDLKNPQTPAKRQAELCGFLKGNENEKHPRVKIDLFRIFCIFNQFTTARKGKLSRTALAKGNIECNRNSSSIRLFINKSSGIRTYLPNSRFESTA